MTSNNTTNLLVVAFSTILLSILNKYLKPTPKKENYLLLGTIIGAFFGLASLLIILLSRRLFVKILGSIALHLIAGWSVSIDVIIVNEIFMHEKISVLQFFVGEVLACIVVTANFFDWKRTVLWIVMHVSVVAAISWQVWKQPNIVTFMKQKRVM